MSFVSYCFWHPSTDHIFGTNWPISMGFSAKCSSKNGANSLLENWKLNLTDFRLILLDHTTYISVLNPTFCNFRGKSAMRKTLGLSLLILERKGIFMSTKRVFFFHYFHITPVNKSHTSLNRRIKSLTVLLPASSPPPPCGWLTLPTGLVTCLT